MTIQFANQLMKLRQAANISQTQLAAQLNVSRQAVSKWENGTALPDLERIVQIAQLLHVSLDELVLAKEPSQQQPSRQFDSYSYKHRPINNGWEFLARYWWLFFAIGAFIYGLLN